MLVDSLLPIDFAAVRRGSALSYIMGGYLSNSFTLTIADLILDCLVAQLILALACM